MDWLVISREFLRVIRRSIPMIDLYLLQIVYYKAIRHTQDLSIRYEIVQYMYIYVSKKGY